MNKTKHKVNTFLCYSLDQLRAKTRMLIFDAKHFCHFPDQKQMVYDLNHMIYYQKQMMYDQKVPSHHPRLDQSFLFEIGKYCLLCCMQDIGKLLNEINKCVVHIQPVPSVKNILIKQVYLFGYNAQVRHLCVLLLDFSFFFTCNSSK